MDNKMLIDATHPEETRVVVVRGNRVEEFDFEAENKKQLKGNIYLAKVTRVEPSLQAAFVDYGGNRHGFLAFSEIHPDYYQIPVADRQALLDEEAAANKATSHDEDAPADPPKKTSRRRRAPLKATENPEDGVQSEVIDAIGDDESDAKATGRPLTLDQTANDDDEQDEIHEEDIVESVGSEDALEEVPERRARPRGKQYKIQEVIKRRQIILVQVVKEERGNKGAALTTYLSLAGRYSVLMPNTDRGGGISRKITNQADRKRLRTIANDLDVAEGMGVILRTAGMSRTKTEIKRDFEYLMRLWENVRDLTLKSSAPALVYEEGSLLKRSIRDLYNKDIDQVVVAGEQAYREAKDFMRMLMPSHAKNVQPYKEHQPIFARYGVEAQLDAMFSPRVTLKSGGYIIINQTEALVSIDVNSGRSTRENSIEETALSTNLETAEEVARQLRLRDLAGLIVIDFIDMEESRNNRTVERRLKECLRDDRARIQVGRISHFGLLEMSRQRIRASVLESTMEVCPHCEGTGSVRAPASVALYVLRAIEDNLNSGARHHLIVRTKSSVALYILNQKRAHLMELENRFGLSIRIDADESIVGEYCAITRGERAESARPPVMVTPETKDIDAELARDAELDAAAEAEERQLIEKDEEGVIAAPKKRRRRRGRKNGELAATHDLDDQHEENEESEAQEEQVAHSTTQDDGDAMPKKKRRRRGRRGGRRERERTQDAVAAIEPVDPASISDTGDEAPISDIPTDPIAATLTPMVEVEVEVEVEKDTETDPLSSAAQEETAPPPAKKPRARRKPKAVAPLAEPKEEAPDMNNDASTPVPLVAPADLPVVDLEIAAANPEITPDVTVKPVETAEASEEARKKEEKKGKAGWWQRRGFF